jgi:hypothetical protein
MASESAVYVRLEKIFLKKKDKIVLIVIFLYVTQARNIEYLPHEM